MNLLSHFLSYFLFAKMALFFIIFFALSLSMICGIFLLKKKTGISVSVVRKIFHIMVFFSAWFIQVFFGFYVLCVYGFAMSLSVVIALLTSDRDHFLMAISSNCKTCELPICSFKMPFMATLAGGLLANLISAQYAPIGYLVVGFGDAFGALIGQRFGKHSYEIDLRGMGYISKTLEGSIAVLLVSFLVTTFGLFFLNFNLSIILIAAGSIGICAAVVEALSPCGIDNFLLQIMTVVLLKVIV